MTPFPLTTAVLNVTNQCNLSCTYCYEYSEDKIVDTTNGAQPKFMSEETARKSVDMLMNESGDNRVVHVSFFGGETLMNYPVLSRVVPYAREQAEARGKRVEFNLTTNATLLTGEMIGFLAEHDVSVTVSIDGPREMQNRFRVFHDGRGSYDVLLPRVRELLRRHTSRPIGARVTLTSQVSDVVSIYRHLTDEIGFQEVGFAPVTTSPGRDYALDGSGFDQMVEQFTALADEFLEAGLAGKHHGFSNVSETLEEIHKGASKAYPCGAGLGLVGVATGGDVALCHRFAARTSTSWAPSTTASTGTPRTRSWNVTIWRTRPTATPAGRARCAPAGAITRRTPGTARAPNRTCTTASGSAGGPTSACASTASWPNGTPSFCGGSSERR